MVSKNTGLCANDIMELRLTLHLAARVFTHIHEEEGRYQQLRKVGSTYDGGNSAGG